MGEASRDDYKIQSFDAETQQLLKKALKDPGAVDLERVANMIVDHSLQDCVFSKEAGRMCYAIIQAESKQAGPSVFRRGLLNRLQKEYDAREQLRACSLQGWVCYVTFICNIFDYLRVNNMPMMALVNPVYDCLFQLAQPESLSREEEVSDRRQGCGGLRGHCSSAEGPAGHLRPVTSQDKLQWLEFIQNTEAEALPLESCTRSDSSCASCGFRWPRNQLRVGFTEEGG
uniref:MIF4G domain-containing protein isoform X1 n=1 Tax=Arvicanthis niloticus TaxID=61156 RepID=UPI00148700F2|nr:MIF4G domain-containing protein isoform X1 [Arvicanthis niloticus]XP_034361090.1 MIF4G domain-containing protein isoform X1 [Arvicanthis niloticus]